MQRMHKKRMSVEENVKEVVVDVYEIWESFSDPSSNVVPGNHND